MDDEDEPFIKVKVEIKEEGEDIVFTCGEEDPLAVVNDTSAWGEGREARIKCVMLDVPWEEQIPQHINIQISENNCLHSTLPQDPLAVNHQPSTGTTDNTAVRLCFTTGATPSGYVESLPAKKQEEYFSKLKVEDSTGTLPDPYKIVGWIKNIREWPDIHSGHIHQYLLCNQKPLTNDNKTSASLSGYELFKSGSVLAVEYHPINTASSYCFLRARMITHASCKVWVCLNKVEGSVQTSHCTCMTSFKEVCSHVAALLFKVEAVVSLGLNKDYHSSSKYAIWNRCYRYKNHVASVKSIDFSAPNKPKKPRRLCKQLRPEPLSKSEQKVAMDELKRILPNCVLFQDNSDTDTASESEEESAHFIGPGPYCDVKVEDVEVPIKIEEDEMGNI